jgi:hypothetical protein
VVILDSRKRNYAARVSIFLIMVALIAGIAGCGPTPIKIQDWYDLDAIKDNLSGSYILMNDLDSTTAGYEELASPAANGGSGWDPIGFFYDAPFIGSLDGGGYKIRDLFISRPDEFAVGLFGAVGKVGVVQNIGVVNADVTGGSSVGSLVGYNEGTVSNSYSAGTVTGEECVGCLLGLNAEGTVNNSYSTGSVTCEHLVVGGLVGANNGTVSNSHYSGNVTGKASGGGLVGANSGTVINSYYNYDEVLINGENMVTIGALFGEDFDHWFANDKFLDVNERLSQEDGYYVINDVDDFKQLMAVGQNASLRFRLTNDLDLSGEANFYIPYLAGEFDGNGHRISNLSVDFGFASLVGLFGYLAPGGKVTQVSVEDVNITAYSGVGGLVGYSQGTVINSYSSGNVAAYVGVGGLMGSHSGTVSSSYSTCEVTGNSSVGGLVGYIDAGTVSGSYSTGSVTGNAIIGGLAGWNQGVIDNSYSTGSVNGSFQVGGLVGYIYAGIVSNSYSTGRVNGDSLFGGLVGWDGTPEKDFVTDSFWDTETSGQAISDGGTGKNTVEMRDITTFSGAAWDIIAVALNDTNTTYIWNIVDGETYPFLSWQS